MTNSEYFDQFDAISDKYLPAFGDGETLATQAVTAVNRLIAKWYINGDIYDNTHAMHGWYNDLSGAANWLAKNIGGAEEILDGISWCFNDNEYEEILKKIADLVYDEKLLEELNKKPKQGDAYREEGPYHFIALDFDDDDE